MEIDQLIALELKNLEKILTKLKLKESKKFNTVINKLKVQFILSNDIAELNKLSLIFSTYRINSAVPLIVAKLISGKFNQVSGTLVYSLKGLSHFEFQNELRAFGKKNISYEAKLMLKRIKID